MTEAEKFEFFRHMLSDEFKKRDDRLYDIVLQMNDTIKEIHKMNTDRAKEYEATIQSLRKTCEDLIAANVELTRLMERSRDDNQRNMGRYQEELQSAKAMYNHASEAYIRLSEKLAHNTAAHGTSAEVKIENPKV